MSRKLLIINFCIIKSKIKIKINLDLNYYGFENLKIKNILLDLSSLLKYLFVWILAISFNFSDLFKLNNTLWNDSRHLFIN